MTGAMKINLEVGHELACFDCIDLDSFMEPNTGWREPVCTARDGCPVDIACLRELEGFIDLYRAAIVKTVNDCTRPGAQDLVDELIENIACSLEDAYCEGARVGHKTIIGKLRESALAAQRKKEMFGAERLAS